MKYENPNHLSPAIHPNIETATARFFPRLVRVIVEACPEGTRCYRKLNALDIKIGPSERTSQAEEEVNAAIMLVAETYASETDEPTLFRAKYMCVDDDGEEEKRRYVTFRLAEREHEAVAKRDDSEPPVWLRGYMETCAARDQVLMEYNVTLTDRLLTLAAQAEPLLRVQENVSKLFEKAMGMLAHAAMTQGAVLGAQQAMPEAPKESDGFSEEVLKPGLEMALWQFFNRGKAPPPGFAGGPGSPPGEPQTPGAAPPADAEAGGAAGASAAPPGKVRFSSSHMPTSPEGEPKERVNAEVVEPVDPIVRTIAMWLGSMDGSQMLALTETLNPGQRGSLQAVRSAKNDDEAATAVLGLQAELVKGGNGMDLLGLLQPSQQKVLMRIQALAQRHSEQ